MGLLEDLQSRIVVADGAIGTLLYSYGTGFCFEELNVSEPDKVTAIHKAYVDAGATMIQTNTYGANYHKLARYGLEEQVKDINTKAVRLAKQATTKEQYVAGTIGGIRGIRKSVATLEEIKRAFREQLYCLLLEGVDALLLETYYDFEELLAVLEIARKETTLPIISQVSMHESGVLQDGMHLNEALSSIEGLGANVVGVNCRLGPFHMIQALEEVELPKHAFLSAYPNASLPDYQDGKYIYSDEPEYFKKAAYSLVKQGVRLIGGCCGTSPDHVREMVEGVKGVLPIQEKKVETRNQSIVVKERSSLISPHLFEKVKRTKSVIAELDPPKHLNTTSFFQGAKALKEVGVDAITLADNSLASPRICNTAMANLIKSQLNLRPLVHITCRDRNLIGLQSHLMGLHTLGVNQLLAVTGDPTKVGDFPGASSVYDVSSFELIQMIKQFNEGVSLSGKSLREKTSFSVAAAFNPNTKHLDHAVKRLEKKIHYGADYFISQPVFSEAHIEEIYQATSHLSTPIYIGIMPLVSLRNAEFLHNEVPGMKLSDKVLNRIGKYGEDPKGAIQEGIAIAKSLIDTALAYFNGIYLITPFMKYELTVELTKYIQNKVAEQERKAHYERNFV
jgi:methionine synthase / methylenetetrahydrofolate reductase(NADPH)